MVWRKVKDNKQTDVLTGKMRINLQQLKKEYGCIKNDYKEFSGLKRNYPNIDLVILLFLKKRLKNAR